LLLLGGGLLLTRALSTHEEQPVPRVQAAIPSAAPSAAPVAPPVEGSARPAEVKATDALPAVLAAPPAGSDAPAKTSIGTEAAKPRGTNPARGTKPQSTTSSVATGDKTGRGASGLSDFGGRIY
jgi:hypothetical protein